MASNNVEFNLSANIDDALKAVEELKKKVDDISNTKIFSESGVKATQTEMQTMLDTLNDLGSKIYSISFAASKQQQELNSKQQEYNNNLRIRAELEEKAVKSREGGEVLTASEYRRLKAINESIVSYENLNTRVELLKANLAAVNDQYMTFAMLVVSHGKKDDAIEILNKRLELETAMHDLRMEEAKQSQRVELLTIANTRNETEQISKLNKEYRHVLETLDSGALTKEDSLAAISAAMQKINEIGDNPATDRMPQFQQELSRVYESLRKLESQYSSSVNAAANDELKKQRMINAERLDGMSAAIKKAKLSADMDADHAEAYLNSMYARRDEIKRQLDLEKEGTIEYNRLKKSLDEQNFDIDNFVVQKSKERLDELKRDASSDLSIEQARLTGIQQAYQDGRLSAEEYYDLLETRLENINELQSRYNTLGVSDTSVNIQRDRVLHAMQDFRNKQREAEQRSTQQAEREQNEAYNNEIKSLKDYLNQQKTLYADGRISFEDYEKALEGTLVKLKELRDKDEANGERNVSLISSEQFNVETELFRTRQRNEEELQKQRDAASEQERKNLENLQKAEQEAHEKRLRNIATVFDVIKRGFNTVNQTFNETLRSFNNGYKTLKSSYTQLMSILGLDEYNSNINTILKNSLTTYAGLYESVNLLDQMYEKDISTMLNWAENSSKAYGIANQSAREYLGQLSGMLSNLGIQNEDILETMSINYVKMAGDLASAFNKTSEQAFLAIRSGIAGISRPLEQFGINLKIEALDAWVQSNEKIQEQFGGIKYRQLSEYNKQMVRYAYILEKAQESQGDFAKTSKSFSNEIKTLKNEWTNLLELIGKYAVPIFKPVVEWLIRAIAYLQEFIKMLAETFNWQIDTTQDTVGFYQSETGAIEDTTSALENKNKELKKGVKLLDLYELDFGDDTANAGGSGISADEQALIEGLANDYRDLPWNQEFDIDYSKVRDAVNWVKKLWDFAVSTFDKVWNFKLGPLPSLSEVFDGILDKLKNDPLDLALDIFGLVFSAKMIKKCAGVVASFLGDVLSSKEVLGAASLKSRLLGLGVSLMGIIISGMGGFNLGQSLSSGNSEDLATGIIETISGVLLSAAGGLMVGGVAGALIGALIGVVSAAFSGVAGYIDQEAKNFESLANTKLSSLLSSDTTFREKYSIIDMLYNYESDDLKWAKLRSQFSDTGENIDTLVNTNLTLLYDALKKDPGNVKISQAITDAYNQIHDDLTKMQTDLNSLSAQSFNTVLTSMRDSLGLTEDSINIITGSIAGLYNSIDASAIDNYNLLLQKQAAGIALTPDEIALLNFYRDKFDLSEAEDTYTSLFNTIKADATSAQDAIKTFNEKVPTYRQDLSDLVEESYGKWVTASLNLKDAQAKGLSEDDIKKLEDEEKLAKQALDLANTTLYNFDLAARETQEAIYTESGISTLLSVGSTVAEGFIEVFGADSISKVIEKFDPDKLKGLGEKVKELAPAYIVPYEEINPEILAQLQKLGDFTPEELENIYTGILSSIFTDDWISTDNIDLNTFSVDLSDVQFAWTAESGAKKDAFYSGLADGIRGTGYSIERSGDKVTFKRTAPSLLDIPVKPIGYMSPSDISSYKSDLENYTKEPSAEAGANTAKTTADATKTALEDNSNIDTVAAGINANLSGATSSADAESKGQELGQSYISGLTRAIENAHVANSPYRSALDNLVSDFKSALNKISVLIETWSSNLSQGIVDLSIPDDITFTGLIGMLKSSKLNIPKLASGAVIPPNNPFLAVLGDQRRGMNVEAPISTIKEAVSEASQQDIVVNTTVYLGNTEFKDYIVDTVIDSNLVTG